MVAPAADDEVAPPARPTFTAKSSEPPTAAVPEPAPAPDNAPALESTVTQDTGSADTGSGAPAIGPDDGVATEPDAAPDAGRTSSGVASRATLSDLVEPNGDRDRERPLQTMNGLDEPLLGDAAALRARWQRVQAGFVDDPKEAVGDAADLIEQTAQALVGALRQRQRQLRVLWERGPVDGPGPADTGPADTGRVGTGPAESAGGGSAGGADTEHLRQLMQRYRALFNQLARP